MMINDQLTRAERIRLESLSQSMAATSLSSSQRPSVQEILDNAERIEKWLMSAKENLQ